MSVVEQEVQVSASVADAWDLYFEPRSWPAWVDSFGSVLEIDGYPEVGGTLRWKSVPAGRGEVKETVREHELRRVHRIDFEDSSLAGTMSVSFSIEGEGTRIVAAMDYRLLDRSVFAQMGSWLFLKAQLRGTIRRSLDAFASEAAERAAR
ncbi:MAG: SRPBCC family protein [Actinomycetota bacterium]|nr:SRPBCC family protein [Actinomycetota bacterium]